MTQPKPLYLCAGLQSSGSTIVSWCFLQREDMDGVFDARNDVLPVIPEMKPPRAWCKITISSFRSGEACARQLRSAPRKPPTRSRAASIT